MQRKLNDEEKRSRLSRRRGVEGGKGHDIKIELDERLRTTREKSAQPRVERGLTKCIRCRGAVSAWSILSQGIVTPNPWLLSGGFVLSL